MTRLFAVHQQAKKESPRVTLPKTQPAMMPTLAGVERLELDGGGGVPVGGGGAALRPPLLLFARSPLTNTTSTAPYL